ncbi:MAG: plasmid mobilization relaxosome protein MobC [Clostridia bacterium]|nr:plasmid mobilization relaxosome protein MobC [Clostridia bacterium]
MLKRNIGIICRFNERELKNLKKAVQKSGLSQEAFIRSRINSRAPKAPPFDYGSIVPKLNAIGKSINQIAACANATGVFLADAYEENRMAFKKITEEILENTKEPRESESVKDD